MPKKRPKGSENIYLQREVVQILRVKGKVRSANDEKKQFSCRVTHPDVENYGMTVFVDCGKYDFAPGDYVSFEFDVPEVFNVEGRVIWVQPVARNNRIIREKHVYSTRLGIEFRQDNQGEQNLITNFLAYLENPFFILTELEKNSDSSQITKMQDSGAEQGFEENSEAENVAEEFSEKETENPSEAVDEGEAA